MKNIITEETEPRLYKLIRPTGEVLKCDICNETIYDIKVTDHVEFSDRYEYFTVAVGDKDPSYDYWEETKHLHACSNCISKVFDKYYNREFIDDSFKAFIEIEQQTVRAEGIISRLKKPDEIKIIITEDEIKK